MRDIVLWMHDVFSQSLTFTVQMLLWLLTTLYINFALVLYVFHIRNYHNVFIYKNEHSVLANRYALQYKVANIL